MWDNGYWELDNIVEAQYYVGKNPDYPYLDANDNNPYETDLGEFGYNVSLVMHNFNNVISINDLGKNELKNKDIFLSLMRGVIDAEYDKNY